MHSVLTVKLCEYTVPMQCPYSNVVWIHSALTVMLLKDINAVKGYSALKDIKIGETHIRLLLTWDKEHKN